MSIMIINLIIITYLIIMATFYIIIMIYRSNANGFHTPLIEGKKNETFFFY